MGKSIGQIYKHIQSLPSTPSIKEPVLSYSASQTSSSTALIRNAVSSVIDQKHLIRSCVPKISPKMI